MGITVSAPTAWALAWAVAGMAFVLVVILCVQASRWLQAKHSADAAWDALLRVRVPQRGAR